MQTPRTLTICLVLRFTPLPDVMHADYKSQQKSGAVCLLESDEFYYPEGNYFNCTYTTNLFPG